MPQVNEPAEVALFIILELVEVKIIVDVPASNVRFVTPPIPIGMVPVSVTIDEPR